MTENKHNRSAKERAKDIFSAKNIARMAVFTALAYLLYMPIFEFSLIPAVPFLKIDFSNAFVMMAGFAMGPIPAVIVGVLKEILHAVTFSQTVGVGELANILIMLPYVLIPSILYIKRRNIKTVFISLGIACVLQAVWSIPVNYLLTFPFFLIVYAGASKWTVGMDFYLSVWYWAVLFNFVKTLLVSAVVLLLYKQFQRLFDYIFNKDRRKPVAVAVSAGDSEVQAQNTELSEKPQKTVNIVKSAEDMIDLGMSIGKSLKGGEVLLLSGELGAGKTVFCKGLGKGLGVEGDIVSPTFTLLNEYSGRVAFDHIDAYRLSDVDEAYGAGITENFGKSDVVCAVEWWENIRPAFVGMTTIKVTIAKVVGDTSLREVIVER